MPKGVKILLILTALGVVLFGGICVYGVWDYERKVVRFEPKEEVTCILEGESYAAYDLFNVRNDLEGVDIDFYLTWEDGSSDGIDLAEDRSSFTVTEGEGMLTVRVSGCNPHAGEGSGAEMTVEVIEEDMQ